MHHPAVQNTSRRYKSVDAEKAHGATYTPDNLARFVAERIVENAALEGREAITILDPAIGDGALVLAMLDALKDKTRAALHVRGFDTDVSALDESARRIRAAYPNARLELTLGNFLDFALEADSNTAAPTLFSGNETPTFDLVIANPPYVRTQIMGSERAQQLASTFGLTGRVDLYQAFLLGMAQVLAPDGAAGIIVSNRFMTTKGGGALRSALRQRFDLCEIWDFGDTKLFSAAVLPAVLVARGTASNSADAPRFTSIYEVKDEPDAHASDPVEALVHTGIVAVEDGRRFLVRHGVLDSSESCSDVWRLASESGDEWLAIVDRHTWKRFGEIGKVRVGVKTCADKIFIRHDWDGAFGADKPELLRPLTTHHGAGRFRATLPKKVRAILYPHEVVQGSRQAIPLENYPKSRAYLESHRLALESRSYVIEAGRRWYEIWVPQDPQAWSAPKLVFRDISERPTFWIDLDGSVVNGDCYWLVASREDDADLLWLACAVANSTFAESFYDHRFNNKLYAGRRRFITQYVEQFPLPDPVLPLSRDIIARAKAIYEANHAPQAEELERELDSLVWQALGLGIEEVCR
ncbi:N-6 DNA methylase [Xanthobacter autotrophicus]|uniref:Eco57I restriction-modification methylase domain-containing protein n=1 Tax=Xanthobacter TaxID=279 RepID=UPI0024AB7849|nr:N-6 DNA methylase [Xanthobacter autotrophicus]MDI4663464.1 N-6 DNA methylase [Xanthobacter autotrophicus]